MKSKLEVFVISLILWCLLSWPYCPISGEWDIMAVLTGAAAALASSLIFGRDFSKYPSRILSIRRWLYFFQFIPVFIYYCLKSSFQVAYLVIHPKLPIKPGIVKIQTNLKNPAAITMLSNCITLTPGTLTVEATSEGILYVHWIQVKTIEKNQAGELIAGKFEPYLTKIFEED